jgi:hypothetical protein
MIEYAISTAPPVLNKDNKLLNIVCWAVVRSMGVTELRERTEVPTFVITIWMELSGGNGLGAGIVVVVKLPVALALIRPANTAIQLGALNEMAVTDGTADMFEGVTLRLIVVCAFAI